MDTEWLPKSKKGACRIRLNWVWCNFGKGIPHAREGLLRALDIHNQRCCRRMINERVTLQGLPGTGVTVNKDDKHWILLALPKEASDQRKLLHPMALGPSMVDGVEMAVIPSLHRHVHYQSEEVTQGAELYTIVTRAVSWSNSGLGFYMDMVLEKVPTRKRVRSERILSWILSWIHSCGNADSCPFWWT